MLLVFCFPLSREDNEATYNTVTAGQLAYRLVEKLLSEGKLAEEEVELLKEKEFSRRTFYKVVYPVLANNREDNKGKAENADIIASLFNLRGRMCIYQRNGLMKAEKI